MAAKPSLAQKSAWILVFFGSILLISCPQLVDVQLASQVEDKSPPVITITDPDPNTTTYYLLSVDVSGSIEDFTDSKGTSPGAIKEAFYEEQYNTRINGPISLNSDGTFSFSVDALLPTPLRGTQYMVITAIDWNDNISQVVATLYEKNTGPIIVVHDHGPGGLNVTDYSSTLNRDIIFTGYVEPWADFLTYDAQGDAGPTITGRTVSYDVNGDFNFPFNANTEGVSGELDFVLRSEGNGYATTYTFKMTDDPLAPTLDSGTVATDNTFVDLIFSEGIYHSDGTIPTIDDFTVTFLGGGSAADVVKGVLTGIGGPLALGDPSVRLTISVVPPTPDGNESFLIAAPNLVDHVYNPIEPAQNSVILNLRDKTSPVVDQVSSSPVSAAYKALDTVPIEVLFNEEVLATPPLTLDLNNGRQADYTSGSGTDTLTFTYTVQAGDDISPLNYDSTNSLSGTVTDTGLNAAVLTLPALIAPEALADSNVIIDTTAPASPAVSILDGGDGINKNENLAGVPFSVTGEAGTTYSIVTTNCTVTSSPPESVLPFSQNFVLEATGSGAVTIAVTISDAAGNTASGSDTVTADLSAPDPVSISTVESSPTNERRPTWQWSSSPGTGGTGTFRFRLNDSDLSSEPTTTSISFTPIADLSEGGNTLYIQERNAGGNWSDIDSEGNGQRTIVIDITGPDPVNISTVESSPTNEQQPTWQWSSSPGTGGTGTFRYRLNDSDLSGETPTTATDYTPGSALTPDGSYTLYVQERDAAGNWSDIDSEGNGQSTIVIDTLGPSPVNVWTTESDPTNEQRPTWNWSSGTGGNGTFRYRLDDPDLSGRTPTTATTFRPSTDRSEGNHTLYVDERDDAGNWSAVTGEGAGQRTIEIDITPPSSAPAVNGPATSSTRRPTWTWTQGGDGAQIYRYRLDGAGWSADTTDTDFTPGSDLADGNRDLDVQERDTAGNFSTSGSHTIDVDAPPYAPIVTGPSSTSDKTPTWTWSSGGEGDGIYRHRLDDPDLSVVPETSNTSYTPVSNLPVGLHTLYVQEKDSSGNWSSNGFHTIMVTLF